MMPRFLRRLMIFCRYFSHADVSIICFDAFCFDITPLIFITPLMPFVLISSPCLPMAFRLMLPLAAIALLTPCLRAADTLISIISPLRHYAHAFAFRFVIFDIYACHADTPLLPFASSPPALRISRYALLRAPPYAALPITPHTDDV